MTLHLDARDWLARRPGNLSAGRWSEPARRSDRPAATDTPGVGLRLGAPAAAAMGLYGPAGSRLAALPFPAALVVGGTARPTVGDPPDPEDEAAEAADADAVRADAGVGAVGDLEETGTTAEDDDSAGDLSASDADPTAPEDDDPAEDEPAVSVHRVGSFVATGDVVSVQIGASASDYRNRMVYSLDDGATWQELGYDNEALESPAQLQVGAGQRILFGIDTPDGQRFVAHREDLSTDGLDHSRLETDGESHRIGFEDLPGGGDLDFDDAVLEVSGVNWEPEAATIEETIDADAVADAAIEQAAWEDEAGLREEREGAEAERDAREAQAREDQALARHATASTLVHWRADGQAQLLQSLASLPPVAPGQAGRDSAAAAPGEDRHSGDDAGGSRPERRGKAWGHRYAAEPAANGRHWVA